MAKKKTKLPADTNQKAKKIVDMLTDPPDIPKDKISDDVKSAAAALGKRGGLKGGPARAKALTSKRRSEIAKIAAAARWGGKSK